MFADLFPLPLTPFEYYYWCDDRADYPTAFPMEMVFSPPLERARLERAVDDVLRRHPLLTSLVAEDGAGGPRWIGGGPFAGIDWRGESAAGSDAWAERLDLRTGPGLRVWAEESSESTRLVFRFHHACCDGIAALRFGEEMMVAYARQDGSERNGPPLATLDASRLRGRSDLDLARRSVPTKIRDWWVGTTLWGKFASRSAAPLALGNGAAKPAAADGLNGTDLHCPFSSRTIDPDVMRQLRQTAGQKACSLNDLFLCALFLTLRAWNAEHGQSRGLLRINMPVSLRSREDSDMPAANSLTFTFLSRKTSECEDPERLLEEIRSKTETIKRRRLGLYFLGGLETFRKVPGLIPWFLHQPTCRATAVLSNVGRAFARARLPRSEGRVVCGNSVLQSVRGVPPVRPLTRASLLILTYAGRTAIHVQCDPRWFDRTAQETFLARYFANLDAYCDGQAGTGE